MSERIWKGFRIGLLACSILFSSATILSAEVIRVNYTAEAATVVNMPFGLDIPRLTIFSGYFEFDTSTIDDNPTDETEGLYIHMNAGGFSASFLTNEITGSQTSAYELDSGSQGVRITDGPDAFREEVGFMSLDGVVDSPGALMQDQPLTRTRPRRSVYRRGRDPESCPNWRFR